MTIPDQLQKTVYSILIQIIQQLTGTNRKRITKTVDAIGGPRNVNVIIPLNRYSFCDELEDEMLVPMQLQLNIELNGDNELVHMVNGTDAARVVVNRFDLWVPKLNPKIVCITNSSALFKRITMEIYEENV